MPSHDISPSAAILLAATTMQLPTPTSLNRVISSEPIPESVRAIPLAQSTSSSSKSWFRIAPFSLRACSEIASTSS